MPDLQRSDDRLSRFLALVLRHKPDTVGVALDDAGFVDLELLARALAAQPGWTWVTADAVTQLVRQDPRRYEVAGGKIRARYGHTVPIEAPGAPAVPPEWLYHGAAPAAVPRMRVDGLLPGDRQFVHLSATRQDALAVASRHADAPVVVTVLARRASEAGCAFYQASPGIYLVRAVPASYLHLPTPE